MFTDTVTRIMPPGLLGINAFASDFYEHINTPTAQPGDASKYWNSVKTTFLLCGWLEVSHQMTMDKHYEPTMVCSRHRAGRRLSKQ